MAVNLSTKDRFSQYLHSKSIQKHQQIPCTPVKSTNISLQSSSSGYSFDSSNSKLDDLANRSLQSFKLEKDSNSKPRRRLKKMKEVEENTCSICLDQIKDSCELKCQHKFCKGCLISWLNCSNKCPYCRKESSSYICQGKQYQIEKKQLAMELQEQQQYNVQCYGCMNVRQGDILLVCDACEGYASHVQCDPTLHGVMPPDSQPWYCHFCR